MDLPPGSQVLHRLLWGKHEKIFISETWRLNIWYEALSSGHLPSLFKLCPWGQKWTCPGVFIFTTKVNGFKVFCFGNSSYSFKPIPLKFYRCLGHGLKMCISFGNNPQILFSLFCKLNLVIFKAFLHSKCTTPPTILC